MSLKNKKIAGNETVKSYKFKALLTKEQHDILLSTITLYQECYNRLSDAIAERLTSVTIGEMGRSIYGKRKKDSTYYQLSQMEENRDLPLYALFGKQFKGDPNSADNIVANYFKLCTDFESCGENPLGISTTAFETHGYITSLIANYRSSFTKIKPSVSKKKIDGSSPEDEINSQVIYEMASGSLFSPEDWKRKMEYIREKGCKEEYMQRMETLYEKYVSDADKFNGKYSELQACEISEFGGCHMSGTNMAMTFSQIFKSTSGISHPEGSCDICYPIALKGKKFTFRLMGNRQVSRYDGGSVRDAFDITKRFGKSLTIQYRKGVFYFILSATVPYEKKGSDVSKAVGVDINEKHMLMATSIVDKGKLKGYVNLYREFLNDPEFKSMLDKEELKTYSGIAKTVNFLPIELNLLYSRYAYRKGFIGNVKSVKLEKRMTEIMKGLSRSLENVNDEGKRYIDYTLQFRAHCVSYFILKTKYWELQKAYDIEQGYSDASTASMSTMDRRRIDEAFRKTKPAIELLKKMEGTIQDIRGCRDNIIAYAYRTFRENGYDTVSLENLESSNFEKSRTGFPTPESILSRHGFLGKTIEDAKGGYEDLIERNLYAFRFDDDGKIVSASYSDKGNELYYRTQFYNQFLKMAGFAGIKDKFVLFSNNDATNIILCPPFFSSQMDSISHCICVGKDGKMLGKRDVRKTQEKHINGLNADYNAGCNLMFIATDPVASRLFCGKGTRKYGKPFRDSSVKNKETMFVMLKKQGMVKEFVEK